MSKLKYRKSWEKRMDLIKSEKKNPTTKELEEAYGYLDYCFYCGKEFTFLDRLTFNVEHGFGGNAHRRGCNLGIDWEFFRRGFFGAIVLALCLIGMFAFIGWIARLVA